MRKSTEFGSDFMSIVDSITHVVYDIIDVSRATISTKSMGKEAGSEGELVIQDLEVVVRNLEDLGGEMVRGGGKGVKQSMASCSYEIAKFVKEWVSILEEESETGV
jgi:hypothetical protein